MFPVKSQLKLEMKMKRKIVEEKEAQTNLREPCKESASALRLMTRSNMYVLLRTRYFAVSSRPIQSHVKSDNYKVLCTCTTEKRQSPS